jgi:hypothetical protein
MTGPQGMGILMPNIMVPSDIGGIGGDGDTSFYEVAWDKTSVSGLTEVAIATTSLQLRLQAVSGSGATISPNATLVTSFPWSGGNDNALLTYFTDHTFWSPYGDYTHVTPVTGLLRGSIDFVLHLVNNDDPFSTPVDGTSIGGSICNFPTQVSTAPNQRNLLVVSRVGGTSFVTPAGYTKIFEQTTSGTTGGIGVFISHAGMFPNEGDLIPAVQVVGGGTNCWGVSILCNGVFAPNNQPLVVCSRMMGSSTGSGHEFRMPNSMLPGDVAVALSGAAQLNANACYDIRVLYSNTIGHAYRFWLAEDESDFVETNTPVNFTTMGGSVAGAGSSPSLLLAVRNIRHTYPQREYVIGNAIAVTGTFPNFVAAAGPTESDPSLGWSLAKWSDGDTTVLTDSDSPHVGWGGPGAGAGRAGGHAVVSVTPKVAGVGMASRNITMQGVSLALSGTGYAGNLRAIEATEPTRYYAKPIAQNLVRNTSAVTTHSAASVAVVPKDLLLWAIFVAGTGTLSLSAASISAGWSVISTHTHSSAGYKWMLVGKLISAAGTEASPTWTTSAAYTSACRGYRIVDADQSAWNAWIKNNDVAYPGGSTPALFTFDFSDITEPIAAIVWTMNPTGSGTAGSGSRFDKSAENKIWSGNSDGSLPYAGTRHHSADALLDPEVDMTVEWNLPVGTSSGRMDAVMIGILGALIPDPVTVTVEQGSSQADPVTGDFTVVFDVTFSEAVTGFVSGDVQVGGTAVPTTAVVAGSGASYTVSVTGMTRTGTVSIYIPRNSCTSVATGAPNVQSLSVDNEVTWNMPPTTVTSLGAAVAGGGASSTTIALTGLTIPDGAVVIVFASCGLTATNTISAAATGITFNTFSTHDNTSPTPDRLTSILYGVASGAGSTITVTFPGSTAERMVEACYLVTPMTGNNGLDALTRSAHNHDNTFSITFTSLGARSTLGFAWIAGDAGGTAITGTGATTVLDYSPAASPYNMAIVKWTGAVSTPVMSAGALTGGTGVVLELHGILS